MAKPADFSLDKITMRLACPQDHPAVRELFRAGLFEGYVADNDTGADIENLEEGYFGDEGDSGFWVATNDDEVIGMIGVQKTGDNSAEIRRLRVDSAYRRRGVGTRLMEHAMRFCQRKGYLKVVLDVAVIRGPAISLFEKFGFKAGPTREIGGRHIQDFYLDLYREPEA